VQEVKAQSQNSQPATSAGLLSPKEVEAAFGVRHAGRMELHKRGVLPPPVKLNQRVDRYPAAEIAAVLRAHQLGLTDDEKRLVVQVQLQQRERLAAELRAELAQPGA
jgi:predicted DNA-binding transcriptional regulator AlpA